MKNEFAAAMPWSSPFFICIYVVCVGGGYDGESRWGSGGGVALTTLSLRPNYFIFMGYSRKMISNQQIEPPTPLIHMNPLIRPWGSPSVTRKQWSPTNDYSRS